jgi:AcrR family transcriptional regulator
VVTKRLSATSRREQILRSARDVFAAEGFDAARTAAIAQQAGVSEKVLYNHFDGKRDLFLAVVDMVAEQVAAVWTTLATQDLDLYEGIVGHYQFRFLAPDAPGAEGPLFFGRSHGPFSDPVMHERMGRAYRQIDGAVAAYLDGQVVRGLARADLDTMAAAWSLGAIFRDSDTLRVAYGATLAREYGLRAIRTYIDGITAQG